MVGQSEKTSLYENGVQGTWDAFPDLAEKPRLLLGFRLGAEDAVNPGDSSPLAYPVKPERTWLKLDHQTAGVACRQVYLYVTELEPKADVMPMLKELAERYYDALGWSPPTLDEANQYRGFLREKLNVDCNATYVDLEEALYPVDPTLEHLRHLSTDELPDDLGDLFDWGDPSGIAGLNRLRARFHLRCYVIAENSD